MAPRNRSANPRKAAEAGRMKPGLPMPEREAVTRALVKSETLSFRLTVAEKDSIRAAASSYGMAITEYLVKCHQVVGAAKEDQR